MKVIFAYEVEPLSRKEEIKIALSSILETVLFHPYQVGLKICATINYRKQKRT